MGRADYLKLGSWNASCDRCGRKRKGDELKKTWNNLWVCPEHWEPRHPQDFVKAVRENPTPPFTRNPKEEFVAVCTLEGITAIVGMAVVDCALVDFTYNFEPSPIDSVRSRAIAGIAIAGLAIAGYA